jgi:hypothetical protein
MLTVRMQASTERQRTATPIATQRRMHTLAFSQRKGQLPKETRTWVRFLLVWARTAWAGERQRDYAAFCFFLNAAHRFFCASAILFLAASLMRLLPRFGGVPARPVRPTELTLHFGEG